MLRPSTFATVFLSLCAVALFGGCGTIYSDMYSPRRNYFKPVKDKPKPAEVLPETTITTPLPPTLPAPPPVPPPVSAPLEGAASHGTSTNARAVKSGT
jgi:hypothetical protein